jgi:DNA-binding response OmpR family regulator
MWDGKLDLDDLLVSLPTLLVVDDSLTVRMSLRDALVRHFRIEHASSRSEAEELLARTSVALVVLDLQLMDGDSTPLLRQLLSSHFGRPIPVLVLSGNDALATRLEALRLGADFVAKPYDPRLILERAQLLLGLPTTPARHKPGRVLIVDDSSTYAHALAVELRKDGHDVVLASNGAEGMKYLSLQRPDQVLLDVFLPDVDGVELAQRVRSLPSARELPLLMLTGRENTTVRRRASQAGVTHFMTKEASLSSIRGWVAQPFKSALAAGSATADPATSRVAPKDLFERVLAATGLSKVLGKSALELALRRAGTEPDALTPAALSQALEQIERLLTTFLPASEVQSRMTSIAQIAQEPSNDVPPAK